MNIISWNVNGIRACVKKKFIYSINNLDADIIGIQEVRAKNEDLPKEVKNLNGFYKHFVSAEKKGYSGVGFFSRKKPDHIQTTLHEKFDPEARLQLVYLGQLLIANVYFPNGSGKNRDNSRISFKLEFYQLLFEFLQKERKKGKKILVIGDFNTAHKEIDLTYPKRNLKTSGFTPIERTEIDRWVYAGFVDTFRYFNKKSEHYTWWSNRQGCREKNIGWRIDYIFASEETLPFVKKAMIYPHIYGSDHCPIGIQVKSSIFK